MNDVYFACTTCRIYIDAGYRHACGVLETPGVVNRNLPVDVQAIFDAKDYWDDDGWDWLIKLLPAVKIFLKTHQDHQISYGDGEKLGISPMYDGDYRLFDWLMEEGYTHEELPRFYIERLGYTKWEQVVNHIGNGRPPWWWGVDEYSEAAKHKFLSLVANQTQIG